MLPYPVQCPGKCYLFWQDEQKEKIAHTYCVSQLLQSQAMLTVQLFAQWPLAFVLSQWKVPNIHNIPHQTSAQRHTHRHGHTQGQTGTYTEKCHQLRQPATVAAAISVQSTSAADNLCRNSFSFCVCGRVWVCVCGCVWMCVC